MSGAATRWRLIELQRRRRAIDAGIGLLDRKREVLLRALAERSRHAGETRTRLAARLASAHEVLGRALVEIGEPGARAAALAQPAAGSPVISTEAIVGVRVPRLAYEARAAAPQYGPGGTCAALDAATVAFTGLLPDVVLLAEEEAVQRSLRRGLRRTTRTLNALKTALLPVVDADIRSVASGIEEEERDEAVRRSQARMVSTGHSA